MSPNWVLDSFEADPNTGQSMLFTAEAVAKEGGFKKSQLDEVTLRRWHQYEGCLADDHGFQKRYMVPIIGGQPAQARRDRLRLGGYDRRPKRDWQA